MGCLAAMTRSSPICTRLPFRVVSGFYCRTDTRVQVNASWWLQYTQTRCCYTHPLRHTLAVNKLHMSRWLYRGDDLKNRDLKSSAVKILHHVNEQVVHENSEQYTRITTQTCTIFNKPVFVVWIKVPKEKQTNLLYFTLKVYGLLCYFSYTILCIVSSSFCEKK